MSSKHEHLQMIQGIVNRLSHNSFLLKGWSVILVSAILTLAAKEGPIWSIYAYLPAIVFWGLDGYFLRQEKLFRKLYDHVRKLPEDDIDFSMDTTIVEHKVGSWISVTFSITLRFFYGIILVSITLISALLFFLCNCR